MAWPPHLPLSPSPPKGRRGDAGGAGAFSLSSPKPSSRSERPALEGSEKVGGEGRGEVGAFRHSLNGRENAPFPHRHARAGGRR